MIPKCMSQMNSPEWLKDGGSTTPNTPKWTQVGTQMFTWTTTPMSRTRQQSRNIEREDKERKREENKERGRENERKQTGKKEKGGENRGREKVKICQV